MSITETAKATRVQIEFAESRIHELNELMARCGVATKKELFNNAISILEWAVGESEAQRAVASVDRKNSHYEILRMPVLDFAASIKRTTEREPAFGVDVQKLGHVGRAKSQPEHSERPERADLGISQERPSRLTTSTGR